MNANRAMEKIVTLNKRMKEIGDDIKVYKTYVMVEGEEFGLREDELEQVSKVIDNMIYDVNIDTTVSDKTMGFLELCGYKHLRNRWYWRG